MLRQTSAGGGVSCTGKGTARRPYGFVITPAGQRLPEPRTAEPVSSDLFVIGDGEEEPVPWVDLEALWMSLEKSVAISLSRTDIDRRPIVGERHGRTRPMFYENRSITARTARGWPRLNLNAFGTCPEKENHGPLHAARYSRRIWDRASGR